MASFAIRADAFPLRASTLQPAERATVRRIVADWRRLTGGPAKGGDPGRRTLIAVSGGADSTGLAIALAIGVAQAPERFVIAHVVHDLRPVAEAHADRDAARELATGLGVPFVVAEVRVRPVGGNAEGTARRLRYAALADLARRHGCRFVATAHHADDQLESVLMGLLRGAGPRGLAGAAARRVLGERAILVRPAMRVGREELRALCRASGVSWREDATNADTGRLRAALRHEVIPKLKALRPRAAANAGRSAVLLRDADRVIAGRAGELLLEATQTSKTVLEWPRTALRWERPVVLGAVVRLASRMLRGSAGRDRLGAKVLEPLLRAIRSRGTDPKVFPLRGIEVRVTARAVLVRCTDA